MHHGLYCTAAMQNSGQGIYTISVDPGPSTCCGQAILRSQRRQILHHAPHHLRASFRSTSRSVISTQHGAFAYWHAAGAWKDRRRFAFYPHRREVTPRDELVELAAWWKAQDDADRS